jgi:hypothetical protein
MGEIHQAPCGVAAEGGDVFVDGPGNIAFAMTPEAAAETSDRLLQGAGQAQGQRVECARRDAERVAWAERSAG